jgi:hypothetical protein
MDNNVAPSWHRVEATATTRLDDIRTTLETCSLDRVSKLQGEAAAWRTILNLPMTALDDPSTRLEPDKAHY